MSDFGTMPESVTEHRLFLLQKRFAELVLELGDIQIHLQRERKSVRMTGTTLDGAGEDNEGVPDRPSTLPSDPFGLTLRGSYD